MVIHFTRAAGQETGTGTFLDQILFSSSPSNAGNLCERCGDQSKLHGVISSCINCFLSGGSLYLFHYAVMQYHQLSSLPKPEGEPALLLLQMCLILCFIVPNISLIMDLVHTTFSRTTARILPYTARRVCLS